MASNYDLSSRYRMDANNQSASRVTPTRPKYTTYRVTAGDTLESIAARYLGNQKRYWEIADLNPQVQFPWDISVGDVIRLPQ
jgi:nucleoid-associated protein YgaU